SAGEVLAGGGVATATGPNIPSLNIPGTGTVFNEFLMPGDIIRVRPTHPAIPPEERTVVSVASATQLTVDAPFNFGDFINAAGVAVPPTPAPFERVGIEAREGIPYIAAGDDAFFSGKSVMDRAADLGVLLCLGLTTHLLDDNERIPVGAAPAARINKAYQVLRNWNMDVRRVNEWRMLVFGNATSEKQNGNAAGDSL